MIAKSNLHFIDVNGIRTRYYDDQGTGDPIVLIHGAHFGFAIPIGIEQWDSNVEALASCGRVIAFDKLGQGFTEAPHSEDLWTFESVAAHAIGFLEILKLKNIVLVGHSRGGMLALHIAITRPDLVKRLVVVSSATASPPNTQAKIVNEAAAMKVGKFGSEELVSLLSMAQATDRKVPESFQNFVRDVSKLPKYFHEGDVLNRVEQSQWNPSIDAARDQALEHLQSNSLAMPVLLVWGVNDRSAPLALGHALFEIITRQTAHASMTIINQAGHNVFIDQPAAFNHALETFITLQLDPPANMIKR